MAKPKPDALSLADTGIDTSLENLTAIFAELTAGVEKQIEAETDEQHAEARAKTAEALTSALTGTAGDLATVVNRRDQLVEYHGALLERAGRIRKTVAAAEVLARRYEAFGRNIASSVETYMVEAGITRIEGTIHRFAIYDKPDQLEITNADMIPAQFYNLSLRDLLVEVLQDCRSYLQGLRDRTPVSDLGVLIEQCSFVLVGAGLEPPDRELDKAKLIEALNAGQEVPGAYILRNRKRLDIK